MDEVAFPLVAALAFLALLYKVPPLLRDPRSPTRRALVGMLAGLTWAPAMNTPAVYVAFDRLVGVPNLARLIAHFGIIGFVASLQVLLLYWADPEPGRPRTWLRLAGAAGAAAAMTVFFVLAPVDVSTTEFTVRYGDAPYVAEYMVVYLGYFAFALVDILRLSWRYARLVQRVFLALGLRLVSCGSVLGVVYCAEKAAYIAARRVGFELVPAEAQEAMSSFTAVPGALLILTGFTIPAWGPRLAGLMEWTRRYQSFRSLYPLWKMMYDAVPEIALDPVDRWRTMLAKPDLEYRLVRRVVEIRDGWLALRPYLRREIADAARDLGRQAGLAEAPLEAVVRAAVLVAAAQDKQRCVEPDEVYTIEPSGGNDLDAEVAALLRISRQINSSIVQQAVTRGAAMRRTNNTGGRPR